mmetsp:Transcript_5710/g.14506  ORF Transcript_5710/g.14506 Transcript_5710/m.14506 type:complete len:122 (-) Transcript_5710:120-485(-)
MPKVCKFWLRGDCKFGSDCRFSHDDDVNDLSSAFSGCAVSGSNRRRSYPMHVYCVGLGGRCGEVDWYGDCPSGCSLHWTRVICNICYSDITNDFDPYVWECPCCGEELHGGITRCGGAKVH